MSNKGFILLAGLVRSTEMDLVLTNVTVSVTELKRDFARVLHETEQGPVAVLNHNWPAAYLVASSQYESLMCRAK